MTRRHARRRKRAREQDLEPIDNDWTVIDGRRFFVAGYTSGGAPYGVFEDETDDDPPDLGGEPF